MNNYDTLQENHKILTEETVALKMQVQEKNQELGEMKEVLNNKSEELKSALQLVQVCCEIYLKIYSMLVFCSYILTFIF